MRIAFLYILPISRNRRYATPEPAGNVRKTAFLRPNQPETTGWSTVCNKSLKGSRRLV
ncbi:hypothetical protein [Larkinella sp.]|uniref:hypothetical protein n=1 Tax=Larkinella sp. TaxID=2034517 RepID=UPI003BAC65C0